MTTLSRRDALKTGLAALGAALGIGALRFQGSQTPLPDLDLNLKGINWRVFSPSRKRGELLQPGDRLTGVGDLVDTSGVKVGDFMSTFLSSESSGRAGLVAPTSLQLHTLLLGDGLIVGIGTGSADLDRPDSFAILGGTGKYTGATGSYQITQRPYELGGNGTAEISASLAIPT